MDENGQIIFDELRSILSSYVPPLVAKIDEEKRYDIYGNKSVVIGKTKKDEMFFASVIIQKHHVGLYFLPIYTHRDRFNDIPEELLQLLKGKSCFHLKKFDKNVIEMSKSLLDKGIKVYEEESWI